jgi:hypothetical protein
VSPEEVQGRAFFQRVLESVGETIHSATFAFLAVQNKTFRVIGSGVLFAISDRRFAFSAAHVLDDVNACFEHSLPVFISPGMKSTALIPIRGGNYFIRPKLPRSRDRRDDPLDVGFVEWTKENGDEIAKTRRFLHLFQLEPHDRGHRDSAYLVYGYPDAAVETNHEEQTVSYEPLNYITHAYRGARGELPRPVPEFEIVLDFLPSRSTNGPDGSPSPLYPPHGISGCGIWRIVEGGTKRDQWKPSMVKLVGIEHTWNHQVEVFRGTRIAYLVGMVMRRYPELQSQLSLVVTE